MLSAGAPVPAHVLERMKACIHPEGDIHTPYGATEALPVASIAASEVLGETAALTRKGAGVCVGRSSRASSGRSSASSMGRSARLPRRSNCRAGEIGELIVRGPVVTRRICHAHAKRTALRRKIADGDGVSGTGWATSGYLDEHGRFWFCGRVAHRVVTAAGPMFPIRCEAIFNQHPAICRSALVGVGPPGQQRPVIILEPKPGQMPAAGAEAERFLAEMRQLGQSSPLTAAIEDFLLHPAFPVDIRHNAKIFREKLAVWAAESPLAFGPPSR